MTNEQRKHEQRTRQHKRLWLRDDAVDSMMLRTRIINRVIEVNPVETVDNDRVIDAVVDRIIGAVYANDYDVIGCSDDDDNDHIDGVIDTIVDDNLDDCVDDGCVFDFVVEIGNFDHVLY